MQIAASTINGSGPAISDVLIIPQGSNIICDSICSVFPCMVSFFMKKRYSKLLIMTFFVQKLSELR